MSDGELTRLELLRDLDQRRLTVETTAQLLGLERRQVFRLLKAYRSEGATGLISRRRGRPSSGGSASISRAIGASASASWCRSTAASTGGSRTAARNARCWCSSTTRRAG